MTTKEFAKILLDKLTSEYGVELSVASQQQIYRALALICRQMMSENHKKFQSRAIGTGTKQVYYLCMEFLMGRSLKVSLFNLGLEDVARKALADADISICLLYTSSSKSLTWISKSVVYRLKSSFRRGLPEASINLEFILYLSALHRRARHFP